MQVVVVLLLGSVVFLSALLLVVALMLRGQWQKIGAASDPRPSHPAKDS